MWGGYKHRQAEEGGTAGTVSRTTPLQTFAIESSEASGEEEGYRGTTQQEEYEEWECDWTQPWEGMQEEGWGELPKKE